MLTARDGLFTLREHEYRHSAHSNRFLFFSMRKKQRGKGTKCSATSELTPAQGCFAPTSRANSPILFEYEDQRPSADVSDMVSFGAFEDKLLNDRCRALLLTSPLLRLPIPATPGQVWIMNFSASSLRQSKSWDWSGQCRSIPLVSRLDEWSLPGPSSASLTIFSEGPQ